MKPILFIIVVSIAASSFAQSPEFYHLGTAEGLTDNNVIATMMDQCGILWVGTSEGLHSFDGYAVTNYFNQMGFEEVNKNINGILVDEKNRVWIRNQNENLTMLDEYRKFHNYRVGQEKDNLPVVSFFYVNSRGLIAVKDNGQYVFENNAFHLQNFFSNDSLPKKVEFIRTISGDRVMMYGDNHLVVLDYKTMKKILDLEFKDLSDAVAINDNEILTFTVKGDKFYRIDIKANRIATIYNDLLDQEKHAIEGHLRKIAKIGKDKFIITSRFSGLYFLDISNHTLQHWQHDVLDPYSVGGNNTYNLSYDSSGFVFVTTLSSGLHYYNAKVKQTFSKPYFKDKLGVVFDGYVQSLLLVRDDLFLGTQDRLIRWNMKTKETTFIDLKLPDGESLGSETIRDLYRDKYGNLWIGTTRYGVIVLNDALKTIARYHMRDKPEKRLPSNWINRIVPDSRGNIWIATLRGLVKIEDGANANGRPDIYPKLFYKGPTVSIFEDSKANVWFGADKEVSCINGSDLIIVNLGMKDGIKGKFIYDINEDTSGNIFFSCNGGLNILDRSGLLKSYDRTNGLINDRCEVLMRDDEGTMWIGNLNAILKYNASTNDFTTYGAGQGFNHSGYRIRTGFKSEAGEMFWGTDKGLFWFNPKDMVDNSLKTISFIHALHTHDSTYYFTRESSLTFPYNVTAFNFRYTTGELAGGQKSKVMYQLQGLDDVWRMNTTNGQVSFTNLSPGNYTFRIKVSHDGIQFVEGKYAVHFTVSKPWWQQPWFKAIYFVIAIFSLYRIYNYYQRRRQAKEVQRMIDYFANSGFEHSSVEDILWDICRNCISRLGFEDCVIYLMEKDRNVLVQKAAYGPKNPMEFEISNPIEIPMGRGIVGIVAATAMAEVINDTSLDTRYIVDDLQRLSEMTVPITHEGNVIGVIDSEHSQRHFFTKEHLRALQTIANITASKISRAQAVQAMRKSKEELLELNVKMAESKFMNLRLQMNPHFLFNSLSSIQHLIVSEQTNKAYRYLTVFSNFLRSLLNYADKNFLPLEDEIKTLSMYVELESLRFDNSFSWNIDTDENLLNEEVFVPALLIQPFLENAIWHGLLHKEGDKKLMVRFSMHDEEYIICTIEDNGLGREKASLIKRDSINSKLHESKGITIIKERLMLIEQQSGKKANVVFEDLFTHEIASGTRVTITIPNFNPD